MQQRFSDRVGHCIPTFPQALRRHRAEICGASRPGNLGAPTAMTTTVANVHTSELVAHISKGPFSSPDPDDTVSHVLRQTTETSGTTNAGLVQMDFMRRSVEFQSLAYQEGHDAMRGRMQALLRRREQQKRGIPHYHYNEYAQPCGKRRRLLQIPMVTNVGVASACRPPSSTVANAGVISTIGLVPVDVPAVGPAELRPNPTRWNFADLFHLF